MPIKFFNPFTRPGQPNQSAPPSQVQAQAEAEAETELVPIQGQPDTEPGPLSTDELPAEADPSEVEATEFLAHTEIDGIVLLFVPGLLQEREERLIELDQEIMTAKRRLKELQKKRNDIVPAQARTETEQPPTGQAQPQKGATANAA
jgi:hypothetical protein